MLIWFIVVCMTMDKDHFNYIGCIRSWLLSKTLYSTKNDLLVNNLITKIMTNKNNLEVFF